MSPYAGLADLMAALRAATDALERLRRVESEDDFVAWREWLASLTDPEARLLALGLVVLAYNCIDPAVERAYMTRMEIDMPPPSEPVPADQLRRGDVIRLVPNGSNVGEDHVVASISLSGADVTISFVDTQPITTARQTVVHRTRRGD